MGCVSICSRGRAWLCRSPSRGAGNSGSVQSKAQPLLSRSQSQPCTPGKEPQAQKQPDMAGTTPQLRVTSAELHWSREPQQLPGVKISTAGPARNSACSHLGIYTALPISSTLASNLPSFRAELITYD